jgi:predicted MFS family arabinose efflux permease
MAEGYRLAFTVAAGIAVVALVLAAAILRPGREHAPHVSPARPERGMTRLSPRDRS